MRINLLFSPRSRIIVLFKVFIVFNLCFANFYSFLAFMFPKDILAEEAQSSEEEISSEDADLEDETSVTMEDELVLDDQELTNMNEEQQETSTEQIDDEVTIDEEELNEVNEPFEPENFSTKAILQSSSVSPTLISPKNQDGYLDTTTFTINIDSSAQAYIYIYTSNDVKIARLNLGIVGAGEHSFIWNGRYGNFPEHDGLDMAFVTDDTYTYKVELIEEDVSSVSTTSVEDLISGSGSVTVDNTAPKSSLDQSLVVVKKKKVKLEYSVTDFGGSSIRSVALWESTPASGYTDYSQVAERISSQTNGKFKHSPQDGNGIYSYLTVARDVAGNVEEFKYMKIDQFMNAGFEMGDLTGWTPTGLAEVIGPDEYTDPYEGDYMVKLGHDTRKILTTNSVSQTFTVTESYVNFAYNAFSAGLSIPGIDPFDEYGYIMVQTEGEQAVVIAQEFLNAPLRRYNTERNVWSSGWQVVGIDLLASGVEIGDTVTVTFKQTSSGPGSDVPTWIYFDTVNFPVVAEWEEKGEVLGVSTGPVVPTLARTGREILFLQILGVFTVVGIVIATKKYYKK
jgi:hypothetical protein